MYEHLPEFAVRNKRRVASLVTFMADTDPSDGRRSQEVDAPQFSNGSSMKTPRNVLGLLKGLTPLSHRWMGPARRIGFEAPKEVWARWSCSEQNSLRCTIKREEEIENIEEAVLQTNIDVDC